MKITKIDSETGIAYEITDSFVDYGVDGNPVNVKIEICYSSGNGVLEFEHSTVTAEANPHLSIDQIGQVNKALENGREEDYVRSLVELYKLIGIKFNPNEYNYILNK